MATQDIRSKRPILVAIDFSSSAREALRRGAARARTLDTSLVVLHVVHRPIPLIPELSQLPEYDVRAEATRRAELTDQLTKLIDEEQLGMQQVQVEVEVAASTYGCIVSKAEQLQAQLVVVGHRGDVALTRLLLGSVAQRVARSAPCPVLVARAPSGAKRMLVTTDFSDAARRGVDHAASEARAFGFELILLHNLELPSLLWSSLAPLGPIPPQVDTETLRQLEQSAEQLLRGELERIGLDGDVIVTAGSHTDEAIVRVAEQQRVDLIAMSSHGRSAIARMALGSVTESVLLHAHCSVLAVHTTPEAK